VRPDGCLDIVYSPGTGLRLVGAMTRGERYTLEAGARTVGIRFQPGMAGGHLGLQAEELTGQVIALEDVWGRRARQLQARLDGTDSPVAWQRLLHDALAPPARSPEAVERAIAAIVAARGNLDVEWAASQAGLSARQFRRRCAESSGLAPKHLCRVLRFRHACALASRGAAWALVAAEAGYCDQAHLIRDFREFTGGPPMAVFSKTAAPPMRYIEAT